MSVSTNEAGAAEPLWSPVEVATFLRVSRSWVYLHTAAGDLPSQRVGGLLRFEPEAIRAYARGERRERGAVVAFPPRRG